MHMHLNFRHALWTVAMMVCLLLAGGARAWTVTATPDVGPPTSAVTIKGTHFPPNSRVDVFLHKWKRCSLNSDANGRFSCTFQIPNTAKPGVQPIWTFSHSGGQWFKTTFTVRTDWPQFGFNARHTGHNPYENVLSPSSVTGLGLIWRRQIGVWLRCAPLVADGKAYVGTEGQFGAAAKINLWALDAAGGQTRWTRSFDYVSACPAVHEHVLYVHSEESGKFGLYAIDAASGDVLWRQFGQWPAFSSPAVGNGVVFSARQEDLTAYRVDDGKRLWQQRTAETVFTSPAVSNGVVLVGGYFRYLYAYRAEDGTLLWQRDIGSGINASPMVYRGLVYAASAGTVYAFNVADGALAWRRQTGYSVSPGAVAHGVLYVAEAAFDASGWHDRIHALRASDGAKLWSHAFAGDTVSIAPGLAVANGVVYVTSWSGQFRALDASDGSVLKSTATGPVVGSPTVANGLVYVGPWKGKLQAFGLSGSVAPR